MATRYGASAVGLVSEMPSGPGVISEELIARIAAVVPPAVATFLLTSKQNATEIIAQQRRCGVNTIQICDRLEQGTYDDMRRACRALIAGTGHHVGRDNLSRKLSLLQRLDAILLMGNQARLENSENRRAHDVASFEIRKSLDIPVFWPRAQSQNVREALRGHPLGWTCAAECSRTGSLREHLCGFSVNAMARRSTCKTRYKSDYLM